MVHCLDTAIGNVTAALTSKAMWSKTLLVFSSGATRRRTSAPCDVFPMHWRSLIGATPSHGG